MLFSFLILPWTRAAVARLVLISSLLMLVAACDFAGVELAESPNESRVGELPTHLLPTVVDSRLAFKSLEHLRDYVAFLANKDSLYMGELDSRIGFVSLRSQAPTDARPSISKRSETMSEWGRLVTALYNSKMEIQVDGQVHRLTEYGTAKDDGVLSAIFAGISGHGIEHFRSQGSAVAHQEPHESFGTSGVTVRENHVDVCYRGPWNFGLGLFRIEGRVALINEDERSGAGVSTQVEEYDAANDKWVPFDAVTGVGFNGTANLTTHDEQGALVASFSGDFDESATDGRSYLAILFIDERFYEGKPSVLTTSGSISGSFWAEVKIGSGHHQTVLGDDRFDWSCELSISR